ncbi:MAG: hypothetical protein ACE5NM_00760 [Sedimentisphaerales bacterium]
MTCKIAKVSVSLVCIGLLVLWATLTAQAYPSKAFYCNGCHALDSPITWISVTKLDETDTSLIYSVIGSDNYNGKEGWAVFDEGGANIAYGYSAGSFTLPKDGQTYRIFWVDDSNPSKGGSAFVDETTPTVEIPGVALADLVRKKAWPEHHHFDLSKDEDGAQTLYGLVSNLGTAITRVWVHFEVIDAETGLPIEELWAVGPELEPDKLVRLSIRWFYPPVGKYEVFARCWYDSDGDGSMDAAEKMKRFSFSVVP